MHSFNIEDFYSYIKQFFNSLNKVHSEFRLPENLCECAWMSPIRDVNVIQFISVRQSRRLLTQQNTQAPFLVEWVFVFSRLLQRSILSPVLVSVKSKVSLRRLCTVYLTEPCTHTRVDAGRGCLIQYIAFLADRVEGLGEGLMMLPGCRSWWQEQHTAAILRKISAQN